MTSADLWHEFAHDPRASAYASMRASDADRDVVLRALSEAYAEGRLDPDELDERSTGVQAARTLGELPAYLADLVPAADHVSRVPTVRPLTDQQVEAEALARWRRSRGEALRMWLFVSVICWTIWLLTSGFGHPWPVYPMLGTAVPLVGTLVKRGEMIESNRRRVLAKHEKAVAKADRKRAAIEPPGDQPSS
ncbi:MAG: DUF1707 SHOCT-like domain-containing protein [Nocardioides sp.]